MSTLTHPLPDSLLDLQLERVELIAHVIASQVRELQKIDRDLSYLTVNVHKRDDQVVLHFSAHGLQQPVSRSGAPVEVYDTSIGPRTARTIDIDEHTTFTAWGTE